MSVSDDPDRAPKATPAELDAAESMRMHHIAVICDEPNAVVGDAATVSFLAIGAFIPRVGERVVLEDGTACDVQQVLYKAVTKEGITMLVPTVCAVRIEKPV
jgi:hypothetical protein